MLRKLSIIIISWFYKGTLIHPLVYIANEALSFTGTMNAEINLISLSQTKSELCDIFD